MRLRRPQRVPYAGRLRTRRASRECQIRGANLCRRGRGPSGADRRPSRQQGLLEPIGAVHQHRRGSQQGRHPLYGGAPAGACASGRAEDGFVVYAGANARSATVDSIPSWALSLRQALINSGALVPDESGERLVLQADHEFKSPSAAAAVLLGRSAAGPLEWKNSAGSPLRQLRERAIESPAANSAITKQPNSGQ